MDDININEKTNQLIEFLEGITADYRKFFLKWKEIYINFKNDKNVDRKTVQSVNEYGYYLKQMAIAFNEKVVKLKQLFNEYSSNKTIKSPDKILSFSCNFDICSFFKTINVNIIDIPINYDISIDTF